MKISKKELMTEKGKRERKSATVFFSVKFLLQPFLEKTHP